MGLSSNSTMKIKDIPKNILYSKDKKQKTERAERSVEKTSSISKLNLNNLKPIISNTIDSKNDGQSSRRESNKNKENLKTEENPVKSFNRFNTTKQLNYTNIKENGNSNKDIKDMVTDEVTDLTSNEGKKKVALICNQLMSKNQKKVSKLTFVSSKNLTSTINSIDINQINSGQFIHSKFYNKKSFVIESDNSTAESINNKGLQTTRNENKCSINFIEEPKEKPKFVKNSYLNKHSISNMSNKVTSSKVMFKVEKKSSSNLSNLNEYNNNTNTTNTNKFMSKNSNTSIQNGSTKSNKNNFGTKMASIDIQKNPLKK